MRCEDFESRLNELLDERRHPRFDALVSRHARLCPECRDLLTVYGIVLEQWQSLALAAPSEDISARVLAGVQNPLVASRHRHLTWLAWSVAASVALVMVLSRNAPQHAVHPTPIARATPATKVAPAIDHSTINSPGVGDLALDATTRYADLARDTSSALAHVRFLLPAAAEPLFAESLTANSILPSQAVARLQPANSLAEVAAGFKPLADSTTGAMHFLFNVLPVGRAPNDSATPAAPVSQERRAAS